MNTKSFVIMIILFLLVEFIYFYNRKQQKKEINKSLSIISLIVMIVCLGIIIFI